MFSVIFEVHPAEGRKERYLAHAKMLKPELEGIAGFIDNERFESRTRPGWMLSHSTWRDEKSVIRWRTHVGHHLIQGTGRSEVFSDYRLRVGEVTADTHPPAGHPVRQQRFDVTEVGRSRACTILEAMPAANPPGSADEALRALGLDPHAAELAESDSFESIHNPGKVLVLAGWREGAAAEALRPPESAGIRCRTVRVIREYGLFDRRESPQYHPPVGRANPAGPGP